MKTMNVHSSVSRLIALLLLFAAAGCQSLFVQPLPVAEDEGEALLYVRQFGREADRLFFTLSSIRAVREDGVEFPLRLVESSFSKTTMHRQRLVATGRIPEGSYSGLAFQTAKAALKTDEGDAALLVPEGAVKREFPFKVERKKTLVLSLELQYAEAVSAGMQFKPAWFITLPPRPIAGLSGFASLADHDGIVVFDKRNEEVTGVVAAGRGAGGLVLDKARGRLYAALSGEDAIEVIDIAEGRSVNRVRLIPGDKPAELALTPDGATLLAVNAGSDSLSFIDTSSFTERARTDTGKRPRALLLDKTGRKAYVFNTLSNTISVVDVAGRAVMGSIATGPEPVRGQFNRQGDRLYVAHAGYPYLFVVDPLSFGVLRREFIGAGVSSMKLDTRTDLLYLGKKNEPSIGVYEPFTLSAVEQIPTGGPVEYMTIDGEGNNLYLSVGEKNKALIMNLINTRSLAELDLPGPPAWLTMAGER